MKKKALVLALIIVIAAISTFVIGRHFETTESTYQTFVPKNSMRVGMDKIATSNVSEEDFNRVLDLAYAEYAPYFKDKGGEFQIKRYWTSDTVNAYAQYTGTIYKASFFGGLARHKTVSLDGFALVVCHEIGHLSGGAPLYGGYMWASNEGQSDYYSTLKCLRKIFPKFEDQRTNINAKEELYAEKVCSIYHNDPSEITLCVRSAMAGLSVGYLFRDLRGQDEYPSLKTPDSNEVVTTQDKHPDTQCRLDSYFRGALCIKSHTEDVDHFDASIGVCMRSEGLDKLARPRCWFLPPSNDEAE